MNKILSVLIGFIVISALLSSVSEARGRIGSHRVGGYNSHGKGSYYVGGF